MNPIKILTAMAIIFLVGSILSGCSEPAQEDFPQQDYRVIDEPNVSEAKPLKPAAQKPVIKKDVEMELSSKHDNGKITVTISLMNPSQKPITSVQSWLSYNPRALEGVTIDTSVSPFALTAPSENTFDEETGLLKLGQANGEPISDSTITVAVATFNLLQEGTTMLSVYDYRNDLSGHASVNTLINDLPVNILLKPESPALIVQDF